MDKKIVEQQEKNLQFREFFNHDALNIAMEIIHKAKISEEKPIGIRIVYDNELILHYLMDGKKNSNWLNRKEKTVLDSGHSSLYTFVNMDTNEKFKKWSSNENYAVCGGGFPIMINNEVRGVICVSGLEHTKDHNLIISVLTDYLNQPK